MRLEEAERLCGKERLLKFINIICLLIDFLPGKLFIDIGMDFF